MNAKETKKVIRELGEQMRTLPQALKLLDGLYNQKCGNGRTYGEFLESLGVKRFEKTMANGRVVKKGVTPGTLREAWPEEMLVDGKMSVFATRKAYTFVKNATGEDIPFYVYDQETAEAAELTGEVGDPIKCWCLRPVGTYEWHEKAITRFLMQKYSLERNLKKVQTARTEFEKLEKVYYLKAINIREDGCDWQAVEVEKDKVLF